MVDPTSLLCGGGNARRARSAPKANSAVRPSWPGKQELERFDGLGERDSLNLAAQVRNIAGVTTAVARGDAARKITVDGEGRNS